MDRLTPRIGYALSWRTRYALSCLFLILTACAASPRESQVIVLTAAAPKEQSDVLADHAVVQVFYATDRNDTGSTEPRRRYGTNRGKLTFGTCKVSIPRDHRIGELEAPSIWRFEFRENPQKHVVLLSVESSPTDVFFRHLNEHLDASPKRRALVFVHGYNVSFEDAARRTAQMAYDLAFEGAPIFYSWPSQAHELKYTVDETNLEWSRANLRIFLAQVLERTTAENIYLIAHSMGNRALVGAFADLVEQSPDARVRFREIILTAPDIDAETFTRDIAPKLVGTDSAKTPVTLYASSNDRALRASYAVHGSPRAGDTRRGVVLFPGIETIDASSVDTSLIGHSYYAENRSVISDIFYLLHTELRACHRFGLMPLPASTGKYCAFRR